MGFLEFQKKLQLNKRERLVKLAERQKIKNAGRLKDCPHDYLDHSTSKGLVKEPLSCPFGPGDWCQMCQHFQRHKAQEKHTRKSWEIQKQHRHDKAHREAKTSARWWKTVSKNEITVNPERLDAIGAPKSPARRLL